MKVIRCHRRGTSLFNDDNQPRAFQATRILTRPNARAKLPCFLLHRQFYTVTVHFHAVDELVLL